ncbi:MAG TPA: hypothetical protein VMW16_05455 [Sedimentisphaerales bacterium]|nr:hypothetical protein [Sedimentisphaerales bacterium]
MKTSLSRLVFVVFFLIICPQSVASSSLIQRDNFLVDCSDSTGKIVNVLCNDDNIWSSIALDDAEFFECVPEGYFIYKNVEGEWYTGNIKSPETKLKINTSLIPQNVIYAAVSHNGKRIIWVTHKENQSSLILTEIPSGKSNSLVSKQGYICVPSWSPDNLHIAYYYGPSNAISQDGYSLMIIEAEETGPKEKQAAPPSLWTKLSPSRTSPPRWSPDGSMILFEGRYDDNKPFTIKCLVGIDGENLRKTVGDSWSQDSKYLFTVHTTDTSVVEHQLRFGSVPVTSKEMKVDVWQHSLPKESLNLSWSDDGHHIVFSTFDNNCYIMETKTGRQRKFFQSDGPCKFYWLSQPSSSVNNLLGWSFFVLIGLVVLVVGLLIIGCLKLRKGLSGRDLGKRPLVAGNGGHAGDDKGL